AVNVQSVTITPLTLLKGAAIGLGASVLAAIVPSWDATRTAPAGVMRRSTQEEGARRLVPYVTAAAVALNLGGVLLLQIRTDIEQLGIIISFFALFAIVVGSAFFTPIALIAVMKIATPITDRLFGVLGRMAPRAVTRSLSRTSVAVAALTVAISVIVGVSTMIGSFRNTVGDWLEATLGADIFISSPLLTSNRAEVDVDPDVIQLVAAVDGVAQVATARSVYVTTPDYPDLPPANLIAGSVDIAGGGRRYIWLNEPEGVAEGDYWATLESGLISVSEPFAFRRGITPENNTLRLLTDEGPHTFTVGGVFYDYSTDQGVIFMADDEYRQFFDDPYISSVAAFIEPDADLNTVIDSIRAEALGGYDLQAQSNRSLRTGVFEVFEQAFSITVALRLLAMLVAFIGILSALMSLQLEQTRQYGLMRAVGLTPRQLWNYTLIQTGLMGTTAGLLALPVGLALAVVLVYVINVRSFGWTMEFSVLPDELLQAFAVALLAALAAGLYPAWRLMKLVTAAALRSE
ncbi:MAG: ABC transporter permease, partial [Burkholderiales bacterium]|nr:ABC transporter permease [Anaerolineae bacterium]